MHLAPCKNAAGFTLVELILVMSIFLFVTIIGTSGFQSVMKLGVTLTRSSQSQTEGVVGLEMLRKDLNSAGYGIPWAYQVAPDPTAILEADLGNDVPLTGLSGALFNDAPPNTSTALPAPTAPRAVLLGSVPVNPLHPIYGSGGAVNSIPGSDYLVLKATNVAFNLAAGKWASVTYSGTTAANQSYLRKWGTTEDLVEDEAVITHSSTFSGAGQGQHVLAMKDANSFSYRLSSGSAAAGFSTADAQGRFVPEDDSYKPTGSLVDPSGSQINNEQLVAYGVNAFDHGSTDSIRMPYNRADYFVMRPASGMPASCNPGTGILYKAVLNNWRGTGGGKQTLYPLLDCVGDLQVIFELVDQTNTANTGLKDTLALLSAEEIRRQLKYIRVYLLVHEGGRDANYLYPYTDASRVVVLGDADSTSLGRSFSATDMATYFGPDWRHYRWKVYTVVGEPRNLSN